MTVAWAYGRSALRAHWRGLLLAAAIAGLGLGFTLVALEGARRAATAYDRLRDVSLGFDALTDGGALDDADIASLARQPGMEGLGRFSYTPVAPEPLVPGVDAGAFVGLDDGFLTTVYRPFVVDGRLPRRGATDEVLVNEALAEQAGFDAGDRVSLVSGFEEALPVGEATVVGIARGLFDVGVNSGSPAMLLPRSFLEAHRDVVVVGPAPALLARFDESINIPRFEALVSERADTPVEVLSSAEEADAIERSLSVQATAFWLLALVAAVATAVTVGQALARTTRAALRDLPILVALGWTPRARPLIGVLLALPVAVLGAAAGVVLATVASPAVPTGLARGIDPRSGIHLFPGLVALAVAGTFLVLLSSGAALAWRYRGRGEPSRPTRGGRAFGSLPLRLRLGAERALASVRAPAGVAVRSALVAVAVGTAGVVGVATFSASLAALQDPEHADRHGWSFDLAISTEDGDLGAFDAQVREALPAGSVVSVASIVNLRLRGEAVEAYAFRDSGPEVHPTLRSGEVPTNDREVVLGPDTAERAGLGVGDVVELTGSSRSQEVTVVGIAVYPELGNNGDLGNAASLTVGLADELGASAVGEVGLVRVATDPPPQVTERLGELGEVVLPFEAPRLRQLDEVGSLPSALAVFLAVLGVAAVVHGILRAISDRRRELSILRSIGFRPVDIRATVAWQGATTALVGGTAGLVGGLVAGRIAWSYVADRTSVVVHVDVPVLLTAVVVPGALAIAVLVALVAGRQAARQPTAEIWQAE